MEPRGDANRRDSITSNMCLVICMKMYATSWVDLLTCRQYRWISTGSFMIGDMIHSSRTLGIVAASVVGLLLRYLVRYDRKYCSPPVVVVASGAPARGQVGVRARARKVDSSDRSSRDRVRRAWWQDLVFSAMKYI